MKKASIYIAIVILLTFATYRSLAAINHYYEKKISISYYNSFGEKLLTEKNESLALQKQSIDSKDNLHIYGSSELGTPDVPTNPVNIFKDKSSGFQINLIGRGYSQSIIHAINIGALNQKLKDEKMVIILSPQWFSASGLSPTQFEMNFSELQFYSYMLSEDVDKELKIKLSARVETLTKGSQNHIGAHQYAYLYHKNNLFSKVVLGILTPYNKFKYYLLSIKDNVQSYRILSEMKNNSLDKSENTITSINWENELTKAIELGKQRSNNNNFGIENNYYDKYIKENIESLAGSYKNESYLSSPEYEDLKLLLDICKSNELDPIFVSVPVHGKWYDYCGFPREDRQDYYNKVNSLISSYNFNIIDLSSHEYEEYFFKDVMHLGWKGWIYIDKQINEYYHNNK